MGALISATYLSCIPAAAQVAYNLRAVVGGGEQETGPGQSVKLVSTLGMAIAPDGSLFFVDLNRVLRLDIGTNLVSVVAGNPATTVLGGFSGDGGPAVDALLNEPYDIAFDAAGNIFIADNGNLRLRRIDKITGIISTVAGTGVFGYSGDDGPAVDAQLGFVRGLSIDLTGGLLLSDYAFPATRIRRIDLQTGVITTFAGGGTSSADNVAATTAALCSDSRAFAAPDAYVYVSDCDKVRRISPGTNLISTYVNSAGASGTNADGSVAAITKLYTASTLAMDLDGNLLVVELDQGKVRRVDKATTIVTTIVGGSSEFFPGPDSSPAVDTRLNQPRGIVVSATGTIYLAAGSTARVLALAPVPFGLSRVSLAKFHPAPASYPNQILVDRAATIAGPVTIEPRAATQVSATEVGHIAQFYFNGFIANFAGVSAVDQNMVPVGTVTAKRSDSHNSEIQVALSSVPDRQRVTITLNGINGGPNYSVSMGFLLGDVNGDGVVDVADLTATKSRAAQIAIDATGRYDISVNGVVTASDIAAIKARYGNALR
ncbi:MAG: dockerin type I domain-containing protein [Betaproteobacteria bacterium]